MCFFSRKKGILMKHTALFDNVEMFPVITNTKLSLFQIYHVYGLGKKVLFKPTF